MIVPFLFHAALAFLFFHDYVGVRVRLKVKIDWVLVDHILMLALSSEKRRLVLDIARPVLDAIVPPLGVFEQVLLGLLILDI